ncbi:hypothetical protein [Streptomyces sp. NPDC002573]|uniref:hypothetical protein n=1 Tax=Streptomyces sp. NPDC002573 TaxID=3364651 RepID=UPI00367A487D
MSGKSHRVSVVPARGGRKYEYRCSCGARGWEAATYSSAQQQGEQHKAMARR